jgi:AcrR family transcriptional regulator
LNKATLYCYYANKDDLIDAIVLEGLRRLEEEIAKAENGAATGLERMLTVTRTTFDFYRRHAVHFQAMNHREHRASDARTTPSAVEGDEVAARIFEWVRKSVERGMEDGSIRKGIDVDSFLVLHFAHVHGVMHTIQGKPDVYVDVLGLTAEDVEASALGFVEYFLDGREKR